MAGGARRGQEAPAEARNSEEPREPAGARTSEEKPEGPEGARRAQEELGGAKNSQQNLALGEPRRSWRSQEEPGIAKPYPYQNPLKTARAPITLLEPKQKLTKRLWIYFSGNEGSDCPWN